MYTKYDHKYMSLITYTDSLGIDIDINVKNIDKMMPNRKSEALAPTKSLMSEEK